MSQAKALWWVWCTEYPEDGATIHEGATEEEAKADFIAKSGDNEDGPPDVSVKPISAEEVWKLHVALELAAEYIGDESAGSTQFWEHYRAVTDVMKKGEA